MSTGRSRAHRSRTRRSRHRLGRPPSRSARDPAAIRRASSGDRPAAGGVWIAFVGAGLAAWAAIALTDRAARGQLRAPPTAVPDRGPFPPFVPAAQDRIATVGAATCGRAGAVGSGRFAMVIDDRLYVVERRDHRADGSLIPYRKATPTIDDRVARRCWRRPSARCSSPPTRSRPARSSAHDTAIPAVAPGAMVVPAQRRHDPRRSSATPPRIPTGLRLVAALSDGFVGLDHPTSAGCSGRVDRHRSGR